MTDTHEKIEIHAIVEGKVQGVCFRTTTQSHAKQLGLVGTVSNCANGSVEIYVLGPRPAINELFNRLQAENFQITAFSQDELHPHHTYPSFRII